MTDFDLNRFLREAERFYDAVLRSLQSAPPGRLRCDMHKGKYPQYYLLPDDLSEEHQQGQYIRKSDIDTARQLAQKEYDQKFLTALKKQKHALSILCDTPFYHNLADIYSQMPEAKKQLLTPYVLPDDLYIAAWYESHTGSQNPIPINSTYITERGEPVRSKSEKIIADKLYYENIPYIYEPRLELNSHMVTYPDFLTLNVRLRKSIYIEHLGMMDNPNYCKKALTKIENYEDNGIHLGDNLIITMESSLKMLSTDFLSSVISFNLR